MKGLNRRHEKFREAGGQIVTISADSVDELAKYRDESSAPLLMLSDTERATIKEYGVYNASERGGVAIPAVFIIDESRAVRFSHVERTLLRVRNKTLLKELKSL